MKLKKFPAPNGEKGRVRKMCKKSTNKIEIPELPTLGIPGTGFCRRPITENEEFKQWMEFARTRFTLIFIWAEAELMRIRDEYLEDYFSDGSFGSRKGWITKDMQRYYPTYLHFFNKAKEGTLLIEEYLKDKKTDGLRESAARFYMHHLQNAKHLADGQWGEVEKHLGSQEELFYYVIFSYWRDDRWAERGISRDQVAKMVNPYWE
jgi:hypothetical protein